MNLSKTTQLSTIGKTVVTFKYGAELRNDIISNITEEYKRKDQTIRNSIFAEVDYQASDLNSIYAGELIWHPDAKTKRLQQNREASEIVTKCLSNIAGVATFINKEIYERINLTEEMIEECQKLDLMAMITVPGCSAEYISDVAAVTFHNQAIRTAMIEGQFTFNALGSRNNPDFYPFRYVYAYPPDKGVMQSSSDPHAQKNGRVVLTVRHFCPSQVKMYLLHKLVQCQFLNQKIVFNADANDKKKCKAMFEPKEKELMRNVAVGDTLITSLALLKVFTDNFDTQYPQAAKKVTDAVNAGLGINNTAKTDKLTKMIKITAVLKALSLNAKMRDFTSATGTLDDNKLHFDASVALHDLLRCIKLFHTEFRPLGKTLHTNKVISDQADDRRQEIDLVLFG